MTSMPRRFVRSVLYRLGYGPDATFGVARPTSDDRARAAFAREADVIVRRHRAQTLETVAALRRKYAAPVLGDVPVWTLLGQLAACVDPTDVRLYGVSQQMHVLQMLAAMEADGVTDPVLVTAALIHDVGKVLLLTGEAPENVVCFNEPVGTHEPGIGLDRCVLQWNHDEFAYSRLKDHVSDPVAWLVRYHSIDLARCEPLMDARDRDYLARYLRTFQHYDQESKSPYSIPGRRIEDYRPQVERLLPRMLVL